MNSKLADETMKNQDSSGSFWRGIWRFVRVGLIIYLVVLLLLIFLENSLIFPAPRYPAGEWEPADLAYEDVYFDSEDGTRLHGWFVDHPNPKAHVLFCHGNGECVAYLAELLKRYRHEFGVSIFAFDYRGYGRSEGSPHEHGVLADGHAAQTWLAEKVGVQLSEVIIVGRSLGGAISVDLASRNGARALVLERTFTKMPEVASRLYPFLPVKMLMKTQFDSASKISSYKGPLLSSHGTDDQIIPFEFGKQLFEIATSEDKQFIEESGLGHNDPYSDEYLQALSDFLELQTNARRQNEDE